MKRNGPATIASIAFRPQEIPHCSVYHIEASVNGPRTILILDSFLNPDVHCFLVARSAQAMGDGKFWADSLRNADSALAAESHGGLTTAVVVEVRGMSLFGASVGDSGAWAIAEFGIVDLTAEQSRKPLVGSGAARPFAFGPTPLNGRLLVATDGIFKYARREVIAACALTGPLDDAADALLNAVRLRNRRLQDDVALILCENLGSRELFLSG